MPEKYYSLKESEKISLQLKKLGWKVIVNKMSLVKHLNSVWWGKYEYLPILSVKNKKDSLILTTEGEILITKGIETYKYQNGKEEGILTEDLVKNGKIEKTNYFKIILSNPNYFMFTNIWFNLKDAVEEFLKVAKEYKS